MVICPICNWVGENFDNYQGDFSLVLNTKCPNCGYCKRHRSGFLFVQNLISDKTKSCLGFSTEEIIANILKSKFNFKNTNYPSVDIRDTKLPDNSYDIIHCCHILEHLEDDAPALVELYRILKPSGFVILQFPETKNKHTTCFDKPVQNVNDPLDLHYRHYGYGFINKLYEIGFDKVDIINFKGNSSVWAAYKKWIKI